MAGISDATPSRRDVQRAGEDAAAAFLRRRGMRILARNWRVRLGELDIVARHGRTLVFVEVKARRTDAFADPAVGVDHRKQQRLRRLAAAYLALERPAFADCRFDVVTVVLDARRPRVEHIVAAF